MDAVTIDPANPEEGKLALAAGTILGGGLVVLPTETVYGVACSVFDEAAVNRIFEAKGRSHDNPLPVVIGETDQLSEVVSHVPQAAGPLIDRFWPGPLTIVMDAHPGVPLAVTAATGTIGVRLSNDPVVRGVVRLAGVPLACTSANLSGDFSARGIDAIAEDFLASVDLVLDAGQTSIGTVSTIVDVTGTAPKLVRQGALKRAVLEDALGVRLVV